MKFTTLSALLFALLLVGLPTPAHADSKYSIEAVGGGLHRFTSGPYHSLFLVADTQIVLTDPIDTKSARWLKKELKRRFNKPVRTVIYSHSHPDHAYGGEVFAGTDVTFVAHRLTRESLIRTKAKTHLPNLVFEDKLSIFVDGREIVLRYHGPNNGRGSISMHFLPANVMYVVDWIVIGRVPYRDLQGYYIDGVLDSTREVLAIDFDKFVGGHAKMGTKQDVRRYLEFMESLYAAVLDGMRAGKSLDELKRTVKLPRFADLAMYEEWFPLNVEGVYKQLRDNDYMFMRPEIPKP